MNTTHGSTRFGGALATVIAAYMVFVLGWVTGNLASVLMGLAGALCISLGTNGVQSSANEFRAAGSIAIVSGVLLLTASAVFGNPPLFALLLGLCVTAVALNATTTLTSVAGFPLYLMLRRSIAVLFVGLVVAGGIHAGAFRTFGEVVSTIAVTVSTSSDLARLISLQVAGLVVIELLHWVVPILDEWLTEGKKLKKRVLEPLDVRLETVPTPYWMFLGMQVIVASSAWGPSFFEALLVSLSIFGDVIRTLLRSGVLHVPLAAFLLFELGVLAVRTVQHVVIAWAGDRPPQAIAFSAGGIAVVVLAGLLGAGSILVPSFGSAVATIEPGALVEQFGPASVLIAGVGGILLAFIVLQVVAVSFVQPWVSLDSASGYALGGATLFIAALVAAELGAAPVVVFCGVAAALVVRDVGDHAAEINLQIGWEADTRRGEVVHATGVLLVAGVGVGLAVAVLSFVGPISLPTETWRGYLALALLLVAVVAFSLLLGNEDE
ncbi:DUF7519 family protein [Haladaptatus cibarius]|uniref:DUF7519 family protein n=1 Tax=Haladaptatus cibarius TaxID=453847 RepID=UPI001E4DABFC|nr:hypothetical protein [Haladaptatus cibarius]